MVDIQLDTRKWSSESWSRISWNTLINWEPFILINVDIEEISWFFSYENLKEYKHNLSKDILLLKLLTFIYCKIVIYLI